MTDHCNAFAARAATFFGPPFGLPGLGPTMPGYGDLADPRMAALIRERAMLLGFGGGAPGSGGPPPNPMLMHGSNAMSAFTPSEASRSSFTVPQNSPHMFWKPGSVPTSGAPAHPPSANGNGFDSLNEMYNMQQSANWYSALMAANNGRIPSMAPGAPSVPTSGANLQFAAAQLAASNPLWAAAAAAAAAAAYGGNGATGNLVAPPSSTGPNKLKSPGLFKAEEMKGDKPATTTTSSSPPNANQLIAATESATA